MDVPPPTPEEIRAATEAKTPMEAAMNRIKYSSKEIRELYEKAEQFTKEQTANERELAVAWKAYEATKAPLAEGIKVTVSSESHAILIASLTPTFGSLRDVCPVKYVVL